MSRSLKTAALVVLVLILLGGGLVAWRVIKRGGGNAPEGYALLTPVPGATGFEPAKRPDGPVLRNRTPGGLSVDFGYKVANVAYGYSLALSFGAGAEQGRATVTVHSDSHAASTGSEATRRYDTPRNAYAVALSDRFMIAPPVPALCIKAVVGPDLARYDLADATLCVAQRDAAGTCHPETLACGLIR